MHIAKKVVFACLTLAVQQAYADCPDYFVCGNGVYNGNAAVGAIGTWGDFEGGGVVENGSLTLNTFKTRFNSSEFAGGMARAEGVLLKNNELSADYAHADSIYTGQHIIAGASNRHFGSSSFEGNILNIEGGTSQYSSHYFNDQFFAAYVYDIACVFDKH